MSCESFIVRDVFVERLESKSGLDNPRIVMGIVVAAIRYSMMKYSNWALLFCLFRIFERTWRTVLLMAMVKQCSQAHISSIDAVPLSADWRFSKRHSWHSSFKHDHIITWDKIRHLSRGLLVAIGKREKILSSWPNRKDLKHSSTVALGHIGDNTHVAFAVMSLIHLKTFFFCIGPPPWPIASERKHLSALSRRQRSRTRGIKSTPVSHWHAMLCDVSFLERL